MVIELLDLVSKGKRINIDSEVNIPSEFVKNTSIRKLENVHFKGYIDKLIDDTYELGGTLSGLMIIPDDITLEDYAYNFTSDIEEKIEESSINLQKTLDITEILWQNILVEVPLRAVNEKNENIELKGDGWRLISEAEAEMTNNPLEGLEDLLRKE